MPRNAKPQLVIEGISPWAAQHYYPAAANLLNQGLLGRLYLTDCSETYKSDFRQANRVKSFLGRFFSALNSDLMDHVFVLDKSDKSNAGHLHFYEEIDFVDAVFVVTPPSSHCEVAATWLDRAERIFIEKPICQETNDRFLPQIETAHDRVHIVDHYLFRACWLASLFDSSWLQTALGRLKSLEIRMIEKGGFQETRDRQSTRAGLTLDMMPHLLALAYPFCGPESVLPQQLWASLCDAVTKDQNIETFVKTIVHLDKPRHPNVESPFRATLAIGKGVVADDGDPFPGKYFCLHAEHGNLVAHLEGDFAVQFTDNHGNTSWIGDLPAFPYSAFLREIVLGRGFSSRALMTVKQALDDLRVIELMRQAIQPHWEKLHAQPYPVGSKCATVISAALSIPLPIEQVA